jgi:cytochrome c6
MKTIRFLVVILLLHFFLSVPMPIARAENNISGEKIFTIHCAGCHPKGGNIIRRGKNLKKRALQKYKRDSLEAISELVYSGKNNMSSFQDKLTETEINIVARYVLEQAEAGWK